MIERNFFYLRTVASLDRPNRCSSSGVVPSAFAMTAPRPKNILAELAKTHGEFYFLAHKCKMYSFQRFRTVLR